MQKSNGEHQDEYDQPEYTEFNHGGSENDGPVARPHFFLRGRTIGPLSTPSRSWADPFWFLATENSPAGVFGTPLCHSVDRSHPNSHLFGDRSPRFFQDMVDSGD